MTSKNKYIKTLDKFLDIMKSKSKPSFYENEKDQIAEDLITACKKADLYDELTQEPTLSECIKEWEERGWKQFKGCFSILNFEKGKDVISFKLAPIEYYCWSTEEDGYSVFINSDLNNLITKTLKALEEENKCLK